MYIEVINISIFMAKHSKWLLLYGHMENKKWKFLITFGPKHVKSAHN